MLFRNLEITKKKALIVDKLLWGIKRAGSLTEIEQLVIKAHAQTREYVGPCRASRLSIALSQCRFIITASNLDTYK